MKKFILFVLCALISSIAVGCGGNEEDSCGDRDNHYAHCECQCLRWHGSAETRAYGECMEICAPQSNPVNTPEENCLDKLSGWEQEECSDALNQCECVEQTLEYHRWAWLNDFIAKEKCLGPMLIAEAEKHGCYFYNDEGGVQHFCYCVRHLRHHKR